MADLFLGSQLEPLHPAGHTQPLNYDLLYTIIMTETDHFFLKKKGAIFGPNELDFKRNKIRHC